MLDYVKILQSVDVKNNDEKFLEKFLYGFYEIYTDEIAAVKNLDSEFIAASVKFAEMMGLGLRELISRKDQDLLCGRAKLAKLYRQQDLLIQRDKKPESFLEINNYAKGMGVYIVHKLPVINHATDKVVGILLRMEQYRGNIMYSCMTKMHNAMTVQDKYAKNFKLGVIQAEVLFCLVLGLREDKVIAEFINKIKGTDYTYLNIKYAIVELYKKFDTNNRDCLAEKATLWYPYIPKTLIKGGSYLLDNTVVTVK